MKKVLVIYAHPDPESFNAAIKQRVITVLSAGSVPVTVIDLYKEGYNPVLSLQELKGLVTDETKRYQQAIADSTDLIFIFPVFWFRAPAILEGFVDKVFVPGFGYRFKKLIGKYGIPMPLLKDKRVLAFFTHGAPAFPVKTIYVNAVKYRFLLGFLSFCFYIWNCKIVQLWSVPFVNNEIRQQYLGKVEQILLKRIGKQKT